MDLRPDDWQMLRERIERLERSNLRLKLIPVVSAVLLAFAALTAAQRAGAMTPRRLAALQTSRLDIVDAQGRRRVSLGLEDVTQSDGDRGPQTRGRSGQVPALIFFSAAGPPLSSLKLTLDEDTELDLVAEGSALKLSSARAGNVSIALEGSNEQRIALSVPGEGTPGISITGEGARILGKLPNQ
jgi:hypothetical protein